MMILTVEKMISERQKLNNAMKILKSVFEVSKKNGITKERMQYALNIASVADEIEKAIKSATAPDAKTEDKSAETIRTEKEITRIEADREEIAKYAFRSQLLRTMTQKEKPRKVIITETATDTAKKELSPAEIEKAKKASIERLAKLSEYRKVNNSRKSYPKVARIKSVKRPSKDVRTERKAIISDIADRIAKYNESKVNNTDYYKAIDLIIEKNIKDAYTIAKIICLQAVKTNLANAKHESAIKKLESLRLQLLTDKEVKDYIVPTKEDITYRDSDDLKQACVVAIWDLFRSGIISDISEVWMYSWYCYRPVNRLIHGERRITVKTFSAQEIETLKKKKIKAKNNISVFERKEAIKTVWETISKQLSKRANKRNLKIVFYLSFIKGKTDRDVASILGVSHQMIAEHKKTLKTACRKAYITEKDLYNALDTVKTCITTYISDTGYGKQFIGGSLRDTLYHDSYTLLPISARKAKHYIA